MHLRSLLITLALGCAALAPSPIAAFPELPVFQDPPTDVRYPGKLIWADLFTEKITTCKMFYTELFGWTAETLGSGNDAYTLFRNNGRPVAGMIYRPGLEGSTTKGTWMPYFSVENLESALDTVRANGGRVEVPAHDYPARGEQAIIRDNQDALVGLIRTTDGDPDDYLADYGEWIWAQLRVREPARAITFYRATLGFIEMDPNPDDENIYDHLWASGGVYRASLDKIPDTADKANPSWFSFIRVKDVDDIVARAPQMGGYIYSAPDPEVKDGQLAIIRDPSGAFLVVLEYEPQTEDPS